MNSSYPIPIWPGKPPGALGSGEHHEPTLQRFPAAAAGGVRPAMLVFPGGGYNMLADHEGAGYAEWFASNGFHAFVLRYRLAAHGYRHPAMIRDAIRAVRMIRHRAAEWGVDASKIGVIGSSAGGHLAATLVTERPDAWREVGDPVDAEPGVVAAGVLCYPVVSMIDASKHGGSAKSLLGDPVPETLAREMSGELRVAASTPPCFVWHTVEDPVVPVENSVLFAMALRRNGVPFELHLYEKGPHGIGLANGHPWGPECIRWLRERFRIKR